MDKPKYSDITDIKLVNVQRTDGITTYGWQWTGNTDIMDRRADLIDWIYSYLQLHNELDYILSPGDLRVWSEDFGAMKQFLERMKAPRLV